MLKCNLNIKYDGADCIQLALDGSYWKSFESVDEFSVFIEAMNYLVRWLRMNIVCRLRRPS
jgi:hypothetical protein